MSIESLTIPKTPKAKVASDVYADLFILFTVAQEIVRTLEVELLGKAEIRPPSFTSSKHVLANGAAFPLDATMAISIWGANTPDMTALATASYKYFIRIAL